MNTPTESDKRLLQTIVSLTEDAKGRPPTFTEIAAKLGYPSSSRGNIQRRLIRLRPTYVDWSEGARTIHVTVSGLALLQMTLPEGDVDLPLPEVILCLLASGLTYHIHTVAAGKAFHAPFHQNWQRGLNMFAAECLLRDIDPPTHLHDALNWCRRPMKEWPVHFRMPHTQLDEMLLDENDQVTAFCRELASTNRGMDLTNRDAEAEECQNYMVKVMTEAKKMRAPQAYVSFRQFLIEHPVVTDNELMKSSFDVQIGSLGSYFLDLYERVPAEAIEQEHLLLCGFCGWTLQRVHGRLRCGDDRCRVLTSGFIQGITRKRFAATEHVYRVRRPIRRYVVAPGIYEIRTMQQLQGLGLTVELWPGYDAYDLRIIFPDKARTVWAIDIKDWRFPHLLASRLTPLDRQGNLVWDRAFYVVPSERAKETPGYLDILRNAAVGQEFSILTIDELLNEAQKYVEVQHA